MNDLKVIINKVYISEKGLKTAYRKLLRQLKQQTLILATEKHCLYTVSALHWCVHVSALFLIILTLKLNLKFTTIYNTAFLL